MNYPVRGEDAAVTATRADLVAAMAIMKADLGFEPKTFAEGIAAIEPALKIALHIASLRALAIHVEKQR